MKKMKLLTLVASADEVLSSFSPLLVVWIQLAGDGIPPEPTVLSQFQRAFLSVREQCHLEIIKVQVRASLLLTKGRSTSWGYVPIGATRTQAPSSGMLLTSATR
jgi:hypothetical protein